MMTLQELIAILANADIDVDKAAVTVKFNGLTKRGEWYSDRILDWMDRPMRAWNVSYGQDELLIMCMY